MTADRILPQEKPTTCSLPKLGGLTMRNHARALARKMPRQEPTKSWSSSGGQPVRSARRLSAESRGPGGTIVLPGHRTMVLVFSSFLPGAPDKMTPQVWLRSDDRGHVGVDRTWKIMED